MRRWILGMVLLPFALLALVDVICLLFQHFGGEERQKLLSQIRTYHPRVLGDLKTLSQHELFKSRPHQGRDAGEFLLSRVQWQLRDGAKFVQPADLSKVLEDQHWDWPRSEVDIRSSLGDTEKKRIETVDLSWMKDLDRFDYWDIDHQNPNGGNQCRIAQLGFCLMPASVDGAYLGRVQQIFLLQGLLKGDLARAVHSSRSLALLLMTTESSTLATRAIVMWRNTDLVVHWAVDHGLLPNAELARNFDRTSGAELRVPYAIEGYLHLLADPNAQREIILQDSSSFNFCPWMASPIATAKALSPLFRGHAPGELDLEPVYKNYELLMERTLATCQGARFRELWNEPITLEDMVRDFDEAPSSERSLSLPSWTHLLMALPIVSRTYALSLMQHTIGLYFFKPYEKETGQ